MNSGDQQYTWMVPVGLLFIVVASVVVYIPAMRAGFIWDDDLYVQKNPLLRSDDGLREIWVSHHQPSQYFPMVYLPAALLLLLWLKNIRIDIKRWLQIAPYVVLGLVIGLIVVWFGYHHQGTGKVDLSTNPIERMLSASRALWFYIGKLVWPTKSSDTWNSLNAANPIARYRRSRTIATYK